MSRMIFMGKPLEQLSERELGQAAYTVDDAKRLFEAQAREILAAFDQDADEVRAELARRKTREILAAFDHDADEVRAEFARRKTP